MKATVTFEVTEKTTEVISTDTAGNVERTDITGTDIEKRLVRLFKDIKKHRMENQILDAIDINKWH